MITKFRIICQVKYLNISWFEALVIKRIKERILTRDNLVELVRMVNEEMDSAMNSYQDELNLISEAIIDVNHRLERLYDAIETGKLNIDDLALRIRKLRSRQGQLQARRIEIENQMSNRKVELADLETVAGYVNDLHDLLKEGSLIERRAFIRSFVREVKVTNNEVVLNYTMPVLPDNVAIQKDGVLPTVHYGGPLCTKGKTPTVSAGGLPGGIGMV